MPTDNVSSERHLRPAALYHISESGQDYYFINTLFTTFEDAGERFRTFKKYGTDEDFKCFADFFQVERFFIKEPLYNSYVERFSSFDNFTLACEYDLSNGTLNILTQEANAWKTYNLSDISNAAALCEDIIHTTKEQRISMYESALEGKEIISPECSQTLSM